eukprot:g12812.t1
MGTRTHFSVIEKDSVWKCKFDSKAATIKPEDATASIGNKVFLEPFHVVLTGWNLPQCTGALYRVVSDIVAGYDVHVTPEASSSAAGTGSAFAEVDPTTTGPGAGDEAWDEDDNDDPSLFAEADGQEDDGRNPPPAVQVENYADHDEGRSAFTQKAAGETKGEWRADGVTAKNEVDFVDRGRALIPSMIGRNFHDIMEVVKPAVVVTQAEKDATKGIFPDYWVTRN